MIIRLTDRYNMTLSVFKMVTIQIKMKKNKPEDAVKEVVSADVCVVGGIGMGGNVVGVSLGPVTQLQ